MQGTAAPSAQPAARPENGPAEVSVLDHVYASAASAEALGDEEGKEVKTAEIRLDNVHYAKPAYYVSPKGSDAANGRSEKTAFATPQI